MPTDADYDARRGSARARGYTAEWDREAKAFRVAHPLCLGCEAEQRLSPSEVTDHVIPHRGDMVLFWDRSRWQACCRWHHDVVKQQLELLFADGRIAEADLWLNSKRAVAISRRERRGVGEDGWPIG